MPKLLFTDEQKASLAKEAGITWVPDTNTFDKEYDPSTGDYKMYMKLGTGSKFFGKWYSQAAPDPLAAQVEYVQKQYGGKTMQDIYGAMISTQPKDKATIRDQIGMGPGGIYSQLDGITQQIANLQKMRAGDQTKIFNAVGPDGRPIDPRVAVAQYQANQKALTEQENNLRNLQDIYNAQLETLTDSEYQRQSAINDKNKTALSYLKDVRDEELANEKLATDKAQWNEKMAEERRQFNITNGISDPSQNIPVAVDEITSYVKKSRGTDLVQCGALGNDYWKLKTGTSLGVGDTYDSKVKAIEKVGKSDIPVEGGVFTFPLKTSMGDTGHFGIVKSVNADGTIEVLEANREWSAKGGKMVTHTYSADAVKKMTFSVAPKGGESTTTGKKPKTFNEFIEKLTIPEDTYTEADVDGLINAVLKDYPTEKKENVAMAIMNRAPEGLKNVMKTYSDRLGKEGAIDSEVVALQAKLDTITEKGTTAFLRTLDTKLSGDGEAAIKTLFKAWFFDVYNSSWLWDDDQYDAVQKYAEDKGIDLEKTLKTLKWETA